MKFQIFIIFLFLSGFTSTAQSRSTMATKVLVVVTEDLNQVQELILFETSKEQKEKLLKKYPKHRFYRGVLKGSYELQDGKVIALRGADITVFTQREVIMEGNRSFGKGMEKGAKLQFGSVKARVVGLRETELNLKIEEK